jgi:hypothetical protein
MIWNETVKANWNRARRRASKASSHAMTHLAADTVSDPADNVVALRTRERRQFALV